MIVSTEHISYQKMIQKGEGSILKAIRTGKGAGVGLIAGGICLLVFALLIAVPSMVMGEFFVAVISLLPGLLMIVFGIHLKHKRESNWLSYYQKETGFTEMELRQLDRELTSPSVRLVVCRQPNAATESFIACFITENYMVMNGVYPYIRRLEDIIAVAFSDSTDIWSMASLTKQDKETLTVGLFTSTDRKAALCREIMQELYRRNANILCGQEIMCEGRYYILERDGATLLRLYREGRTLTLAE